MTIEKKLKIGEMPEPLYLQEMSNTDPDNYGNMIKWIGIKAYGFDVKVKDFLWWRNFKVGDLNDKTCRHDVASFITRVYLEREAELAMENQLT